MFFRKQRSSSRHHRVSSSGNQAFRAKGRRMSFEVLEDRQLLSICTWTGNGLDPNWSLSDNWQSGRVPASGDSVVFPAGLFSYAYNDLTGTPHLSSIEIDNGGTQLYGNALSADSIKLAASTGISYLCMPVATNNINGVLTVDVGAGSTLSVTTGSGYTGRFQDGSLSGSLVKTGSGLLNLVTTSTYSGATTIQDGTLALLNGDNRLPTGTTVTLGDSVNNTAGVLRVGYTSGPISQTVAGLLAVGAGQSHVVGGATTNSSLTISPSGSNLFGGIVGGSGINENNLSLIKAGAGTLTLTGASTYSGTTAVQSGILAVTGGANRLPKGTAVTLGNGSFPGVLQLGDATAGCDQELAGLYKSGTSGLNRVECGATYSTPPTLTLNIPANATDAYYGILGLYNPTFGLKKTGDGTLALLDNYPNMYTGHTWLEGGVLSFAADTLMGTDEIFFPANPNQPGLPIGTLQWAAGNTEELLQPISIAGAQTATLDTNGNNVLLTSDISGSGFLTKVGAGTLTLNGANTYSGGTLILAGDLAFNSQGNVPSSGNINPLAPGALDVSGAYTTVNGWLNTGRIATGCTGALALTANNSETINMTQSYSGRQYPNLCLGAAANATFSGTLTPYTAGTYYLGGGAGTLTVANTATLPSTPQTVWTYGNVTLAKAISGGGGFTKQGSGKLTLTGTNTYSGGTTISAGDLAFGSGAVPSTGTITINAPAALDVCTPYPTVSSWLASNKVAASSTGAIGLTANSNETINMAGYSSLCLGAATNVTYSGTLTPYTAGAYNLGGGAGVLTVSSTLGNHLGNNLSVNGSVILTSALSGAGGLTKRGPGTLTLAAQSNYTDDTYIQNGIVAIGTDSALPSGTTVFLGDSSNNSGVLQLGAATVGFNQTLAGLYTIGSGTGNMVTGYKLCSSGAMPALTLNISGSDTFAGQFGSQSSDGWFADPNSRFSLVKTGSGTLALTNSTNCVGGTVLSAGTLSFTSAVFDCAFWNFLVFDGGTLQWASGNTSELSDLLGVSINANKTATLDTNGNNVTFWQSISGASGAGLTKTGAGTLIIDRALDKFTDTAVTVNQGAVRLPYSSMATGSVTVNNGGTLDAPNGFSITGNLTLNSGSIFKENVADFKSAVTNTGGTQVNVAGAVTINNGATLLADNSAVQEKTYGAIWTPIKNDGSDAVGGWGYFNGLPEGADVYLNGVHYFITYHYNLENGSFGNGNDVALCTALTSIPISTGNYESQAAVTNAVVDQHLKDATRHTEYSQPAAMVSQYTLPASLSSVSFATLSGITWPGTPTGVSYAIRSEDAGNATLNGNVLTFSQSALEADVNHLLWCRVLVTITGASGNYGNYNTTLEVRLRGTIAGGQLYRTTYVDQYMPDTLVAANNLLVLYNADVPASVDLKNYYLANRPGVAAANTLGITGLGPYLSNFDHDITTTGSTSLVSQVMTWIQNNPTKPIRYIVALAGLPSHRSDDGFSVSYLLRNDSGWGTGLPVYTGADQFTVAEYGAPLVDFLDCGDNTPNLTAYWRLDENTGGLAYDAAAVRGLADTGTLVNNPTWRAYPNSEIGNCLSFNGSNQYVSVPYSADLQITPNSNVPGVFTLSCWAKSTNAGNWGNTGGAGNGTFISAANSFSLGAANQTTTTVQFTAYVGGTARTVSYTPAASNVWRHYAATASYNAGANTTTLSLFVDGTRYAWQDFAGRVAPNSSPVYLGSGGAANYLNGSLDEVRIYNTALSGYGIGEPPGGDIGELYFQGPSGAVSHLSTLDGQGQQTSLSPASYSVQPLTLANGAVQYGDAAITYTSIPSQYLGCTVVKTANADNANASLALCFDYNSMTDVYVLVDNLITSKPSWLTTLGFTPTSDTVTNSAGHSFTVYSAFAAVNGICGLHLGANNGTTGSQMYSVWAKPRPTGVPFWLSPGSYGVQSFGMKGGGAVSQYVSGSSATFSSAPSKYLGATLIQTSNADNQNGNLSMSFWLSTGDTVYILHDDAIATKPSWLTSQYTATADKITNSDGHTFTVYASTFSNGPPALGPNNGNANSEMYSVLVAPLCWNAVRNCGAPPMDHGMLLPSANNGYANSKAFIDKEKAVANAGGLQADGVTVNGAAGGVVGTNSKWILDDTPYTSYGLVFYDWQASIKAEGVSDANVAYAYGLSPNLSSNETGSTPLEPTAYESKGAHCNGYPLFANDWANPQYNTDPHVVFTGKAGWWAATSFESYDGVYNDWCFADPTDAFAPDAFGGGKNAPAGGNSAPYANTPVCWVGNTVENGTGGADNARYFTLWARGWSSVEGGWASQDRPWSALIVSDIGLTRNNPATPATPTLQTPTVVSSNEIDLNWSNNATPYFHLTGFGIRRSTDGVNFSLIATVGSTTTSYHDTTVTAGTAYWYKVEAYFNPWGTANPNLSAYSSAQCAVTPLSLPGNLVGYWRFDENGGAAAYDTATGGSTADTATVNATWKARTDSRLGNSLSFNGTSQYVMVSSSSELNFGASTPFTLSAWVKLDNSVQLTDSSSYYPILAHGDAANANYHLSLRGSSTYNGVYAAVKVGANSVMVKPDTDQSAVFNDHGWHLVTVTRDAAGNGYIYIDGVKKNASAATGMNLDTTNSDPLYIGRRLSGGTNSYFKGGIDEVRVYNAALSAADIAALYNQANLSVTETDGHGTVQNSALWFSSLRYSDDGSMSFNGIADKYYGSTFIQTRSADRTSTGNQFMSFTLSSASMVYIMYDDAVTSSGHRPSWLTSQFTDTGENAVIGGHTFSIYRSARAAGTIWLGGNTDDGVDHGLMYSVFFQPLCWSDADHKVV